jgi:hypothetical protein
MTGKPTPPADKPGHKPSETHTLDEVLKSLQDLIRNELLDAEPKPPPPPKPRYGKVGRPRKVVEPKPPLPTKQEMLAAHTPLNLDQVMASLRALVSEELSDEERGAAPALETAAPAAPPEEEPITLAEAFSADDVLYAEPLEADEALVPTEPEPAARAENKPVPPGGLQEEFSFDSATTIPAATEFNLEPGTVPSGSNDEAIDLDLSEDEALAPNDETGAASAADSEVLEEIEALPLAAPTESAATDEETEEGLTPVADESLLLETETPPPRIEPLPTDILTPLPALRDVADVLSDEPVVEAGTAAAPANELDDIPVLSDVVAPGHAPSPPPADAHSLAIRVIARANIERRKRGEPQLDPKTVHQIELILEEELEKAAPKGENGGPSQS